MTIQVRKGGSWKSITAAQVFANGAWRPLVAIKVRAGGAWRTVANFTTSSGGGGGGGGGGTLSLTIAPSPFAAVGAPGTLSKNLTATPSGGLAPYSYSWSVVSGTGVTIANPALATITASATVGSGEAVPATLSCTATDSLGTSSPAVSVNGTFTGNSTSGVGGTGTQ